MREHHIERGNWIPGVSDGLTLPCGVCGKIPKFDYKVDSDFWRKVVAEKDRLGVVCLPCFDKLASDKGLDVAKHLKDVQFTGIGKTIKLLPVVVYYYKERKREEITELFEIQEFVKTDEPVETIAYATGREEANEKFRKAVENRRGKAIRMIQVICDFVSMEKKK